MQTPTVQSGEIRQQFMMLLLAQLRNQDPLSPVQQHEFIAQLAQFSSLEGIERINEGVDRLAELGQASARQQELLDANQLIGRTISFTPASPGPDGNAPSPPRYGVVGGVLVEPEGIRLAVGAERVPLDRVHSVLPTPEPTLDTAPFLGGQPDLHTVANEPSEDSIAGLLEQLQNIL